MFFAHALNHRANLDFGSVVNDLFDDWSNLALHKVRAKQRKSHRFLLAQVRKEDAFDCAKAKKKISGWMLCTRNIISSGVTFGNCLDGAHIMWRAARE